VAKNIVICCDGTGNEIGTTISNVLKLFRILETNERQRVYYNPGVGTIGQQNAWQRFRQKARGVFGLATGQGLDDDVLSAYRFLCSCYEEGDRVWLFGFSRGAYTVRVLAAFTHMMGLLPRDQLNLAGYAFSVYKRSSAASRKEQMRSDAQPPSTPRETSGGDGDDGDDDERRSPALEAAWHFSRVAGGKPVRFAFLGVWDTVASVIVPRDDTLLPDLQTLRFTRTNPTIPTVRHAMALDERRRMFRLNRWIEPQPFRPDPFRKSSEVPQDIRQVWFAGVHADIGGGYPETESALSKYPLAWMIEEAAAKGLLVNRAMINHLVLGKPRKGSRHTYVSPDFTGPIHNSMTLGWKLLEYLPKKAKWHEWPARRILLGWYWPCAEPRPVPENALIHWSAIARRDARIGYAPVNVAKSPPIEGAPPAGSDEVPA
jgi:uncharacterized protein (DUF2235 family)